MKFDKTAFEKLSFTEADNSLSFWLNKTPAERLTAAWRLTLLAYNLNPDLEHELDRTRFEIIKRT